MHVPSRWLIQVEATPEGFVLAHSWLGAPVQGASCRARKEPAEGAGPACMQRLVPASWKEPPVLASQFTLDQESVFCAVAHTSV